MSPPLGAPVHAESHPGDPMTAPDIEPDDAPDLGDTAEDLLHQAATIALALSKEPNDPATNALVAQVLALAGTGYAQLAGIDFAQEQGNRQASLFGELLAEWRATTSAQQPTPAPDAPADFLIDSTDDQWTHTGNGLYESKQDPGLFDVPIDQIRAQWGPVREFVLRPPRPAG